MLVCWLKDCLESCCLLNSQKCVNRGCFQQSMLYIRQECFLFGMLRGNAFVKCFNAKMYIFVIYVC